MSPQNHETYNLSDFSRGLHAAGVLPGVILCNEGSKPRRRHRAVDAQSGVAGEGGSQVIGRPRFNFLVHERSYDCWRNN